MIDNFWQLTELVTEAERSAYMLGSHSAREGEKPRGFSKNPIADLGFYKKDPTADASDPSLPVPEGVKSTVKTIVECFIHIHKIGKSELLFDLLVPYIKDFEYFRKTLVEHSRVLEVLERLRARLERAEGKAAKTPGEENDISDQISKLKAEIEKAEKTELSLETQVTELSQHLEEQRPELQEKIINLIASLCAEGGTPEGSTAELPAEFLSRLDNPKEESAEEPVKKEKVVKSESYIKNAFHRYVDLVYSRREDAIGGLTRSYLLLDPIVSFMRFYNNAMLLHKRRQEREADKVSVFASMGKKGKNVLKQSPEYSSIKVMVDMVNDISDTRRKGGKSTDEKYKAYVKVLTTVFDRMQSKLDLVTKSHLKNLILAFVGGKSNEADLKRYIINNVTRQLKK